MFGRISWKGTTGRYDYKKEGGHCYHSPEHAHVREIVLDRTVHREGRVQQNSITKKGKQMYVSYQKKGKTGKDNMQEEAEIDTEAAEVAWHNFKTFFSCFRDHPALGLRTLQ